MPSQQPRTRRSNGTVYFVKWVALSVVHFSGTISFFCKKMMPHYWSPLHTDSFNSQMNRFCYFCFNTFTPLTIIQNNSINYEKTILPFRHTYNCYIMLISKILIWLIKKNMYSSGSSLTMFSNILVSFNWKLGLLREETIISFDRKLGLQREETVGGWWNYCWAF